MSQFLTDQLKKAIGDNRAIAVVGAGVSISAAPDQEVASWEGLLRNGVDRCASVGIPRPKAEWKNIMVKLLRIGDIVDWLMVAEEVASRLGAPKGGEYASWLRDTIGQLKVTDSSLIEALAQLKIPITTTNYDNLIETVTGLDPVTWKDKEKAKSVLQSKERSVLHLHGYYEKPETVVLGIRSYEDLLRDQYSNTLQKFLPMFCSIIFVGCGGTLNDPNISALIKWVTEVLSEDQHRHYNLIRNDEARSSQPVGRIFPLGYGNRYEELSLYIDKLAPDISNITPSTQVFEQMARMEDEQFINFLLRNKQYIREFQTLSAKLYITNGVKLPPD